MIYGAEINQYDKISEDVDVPEARKILLKHFDLLSEKDCDNKLGEKIITYFKSPYEKIFCLLIDVGIGYSTLIMLSRNITPEFWTSQNALSIRNRHKPLLNAINSEGEFNFKFLEAKEAKQILLRYFDLLPEEENHDEDLFKILIPTIREDNEFNDLLEFTAINPLILIYIIENLDSKFFSTGRGKPIKDKLIQRTLL